MNAKSILKTLPATLTTFEICDIINETLSLSHEVSPDDTLEVEIALLLELSRLQYENYESLPLPEKATLTSYIKKVVSQNAINFDGLDGIIGIILTFGLQDALEFIKKYNFKDDNLSEYLASELKDVPNDVSDPYREDF